MDAPVTPETFVRWPERGRCCFKNAWVAFRATVTEVRGPFGPRHRWSLWILGRWPSLFLRFPGGAAPREPPFVGVSAGSGPPTREPYAAARQRPQGRPGGITCVRTGSEGLSGGNWMATCVLPVRRACRCDRALVRPFQSYRNFCPFGGLDPAVRRACFGGPSAPPGPLGTRYLVDSASSHMLVSKIKPCMSKYKHFIL